MEAKNTGRNRVVGPEAAEPRERSIPNLSQMHPLFGGGFNVQRAVF